MIPKCMKTATAAGDSEEKVRGSSGGNVCAAQSAEALIGAEQHREIARDQKAWPMHEYVHAMKSKIYHQTKPKSQRPFPSRGRCR